MTRRDLLPAMLLLGGCTSSAPQLDWAVEEPDAPASNPGASIPDAREAIRTSGSRSRGAACIEDVVADAVGRLGEALGDATQADDAELQISRVADLDADGAFDLVVFAEEHCGVSGNCPRSIYLTRDGCLTHAGTFWWAHLDTLDASRRGVRDLELYVKGGCAGLEGTILRLGWSRGRYEVVETIQCSCIDEVPEPNPACPGFAS